MRIEELLEPKILIISGKGGVGKTTVAAALALVAARNGRKVCVADVDRKGTLPKLFGSRQLTYDGTEMFPGVWGLNIVPEDALAEYLKAQYHMKRISKVFLSSHFVDFITTAAPGLKDILVLGKVWYLEQNQGSGPRHGFDTIIVDAPASGHMLTFLSAPVGLSDAVRLGPVHRQADWLNSMLQDPKRTRAHFVTLAEEMPVSETLETSHALNNRVKMSQGIVFANGIYSELLSPQEEKTLAQASKDGGLLRQEAKAAGLSLDQEDVDELIGYAEFLQARRTIQSAYLKKLRKGLSEPVLELPFVFSAGLALPDIEILADVIEEQVAGL